MRHFTVHHFILLVVSWLFVAACANAQGKVAETAKGAQPKYCLNLLGISDMTVINNRTLLFEMSGHKYYVNKLPHACYGMNNSSNPIMYETALDSLCSLDIITVLEPAGNGFMRGPSCGLGKFTPITRAAAKQLKSKRRH